MSYLGLFHLAPHLTTFDSKLQSRMSYPDTLFIEATANPFYQEIGGVLTGCKSISEFKECSEVRDKCW